MIKLRCAHEILGDREWAVLSRSGCKFSLMFVSGIHFSFYFHKPSRTCMNQNISTRLCFYVQIYFNSFRKSASHNFWPAETFNNLVPDFWSMQVLWKYKAALKCDKLNHSPALEDVWTLIPPFCSKRVDNAWARAGLTSRSGECELITIHTISS